MSVTWGTFRRSAVVAAFVAAGVLTGQVVGVFTGASGGAASSVSLGTASATAQGIKVNPQAGALSLGITFGTTLTNYQNKVAIAEARGIDLGIIGTLLAAEGCDGGDPTLPADQQPQPVHVEARGDQHSVSGSGTDYGAGLFNKTVKATDQPYADSVATTAPLSIPGVLEIGPGRSESISQFLANGTREAVATTDISSITLGPAAAGIKLVGLHWEVKRDSGASEATVQKFSLGALTVANMAVPLTDTTSLIGTVNGALKNLGIELVPPTPREGAGFLYVDPLKIGVVPNATRDSIAGQLLGTLQPARKSLVDFLVKQDCGNATYVTVADIVVGSLTGAGAFEIEVGGVHASSGEFSQFSFPTLPAVPNVADIVTPAVPEIPATPGSVVAGAVTNAPTLRTTRPLKPAAQIGKDGKRGGALALAAVIGMGLIGLTVELDRRKMRAAQRAAVAAETGAE